MQDISHRIMRAHFMPQKIMCKQRIIDLNVTKQFAIDRAFCASIISIALLFVPPFFSFLIFMKIELNLSETMYANRRILSLLQSAASYLPLFIALCTVCLWIWNIYWCLVVWACNAFSFVEMLALSLRYVDYSLARRSSIVSCTL